MDFLNFSRYRVLKRLGSGGVADVYLAEDKTLHRNVALKLLRREVTVDPDVVERFRQEAQWISILNHPNVLTIFEIGETDGHHWMATEYIEGETLRARLKRKPLSLEETLQIAIGVCSALVAAHEVWLVHRDIKPENLMLRHDGFVKVVDFGIAKLTQRTAKSITKPKALMGTLPYLSPEQAQGIAVDPRTDVWGLGVVLYEMVAGAAPFGGDTFIEMLEDIKHRHPAPLRERVAGLGLDVDAVVMRALQKDMEERYPSTREMLDDLRALQRQLIFQTMSEERSSLGS